MELKARVRLSSLSFFVGSIKNKQKSHNWNAYLDILNILLQRSYASAAKCCHLAIVTHKQYSLCLSPAEMNPMNDSSNWSMSHELDQFS